MTTIKGVNPGGVYGSIDPSVDVVGIVGETVRVSPASIAGVNFICLRMRASSTIIDPQALTEAIAKASE